MKHDNLISAQEKFFEGDKEKAKRICLNLIQQKLDSDVLNFLGVIELSNKNYLESFKNFNKSLKVEPNNVKALNNIGNVLIAKNKNNFAISFLKKAISIDNKFTQKRRDAVIKNLANKGIEARNGFYSPSELPMFSKKKLRTCLMLSRRIICLPFYEGLTEAKVKYICSTFDKILK